MPTAMLKVIVECARMIVHRSIMPRWTSKLISRKTALKKILAFAACLLWLASTATVLDLAESECSVEQAGSDHTKNR